jgi:putative flippase GtrA
MKPVILIPAYEPHREKLPEIIKGMLSFDIENILVVNDGSTSDFDAVFETIDTIDGVRVIRHDKNKGKGEALRTGFKHILQSGMDFSSVITMDADGQHLPLDVKKVIQSANENPEALIMGVRDFKGEVPARSLLGNKVTYLIFRGFVGCSISDTQTGLRGIPIALLNQLIDLKSQRYAFELDMLLSTIQDKIPIIETTITTVYEDNNAISSFRLIEDSIMIYKTLFLWWFVNRFTQMVKYSLSGASSTVADFGTYILIIDLSGGFVAASIAARVISVIIHFFANRYFTFSVHDRPSLGEIGKYLMVVLLNLSFSILFIYLFVTYLSLGEVVAKVAAQLILFIATYALLNGFVFLRSKK